MLKVMNITLAPEKYGEAYECVVGFQVGDASYNTVKIKLPPEATREIVDAAVAKAAAMMTVTDNNLLIAGEPRAIPLVEEAAPPPPEFVVAEGPLPTVEAYPVPATEEPI